MSIPRNFSGYERGFLEAAIDSEGWLAIRKERGSIAGQPILVVSNICKPWLEKIRTIVGSGSIGERKPRPGSLQKHIIYTFELHSKTLRWVLPQLKLIVKEKQRLEIVSHLAIHHPGGPNAIQSGPCRLVSVKL